MKNSIPKKFKKSIEYESKIKKINFLDGHISYKSFNLANNEDVKEFYLGGGKGERKSFKNLKSYKRRKRWL